MKRHALAAWTIPSTMLLAVLFAGAWPAHAGTLPRAMDPLVQNMDTKVKPGDDFFHYANGAWLRAHPIPPAERSWGIGNIVHEDVYRQLRGICEAAAASGAPRGSIDQNVGDFWTTGMDSVAIERAGAAPLKPYLDEVAAIRTRADLQRTVAHFQRLGFGSAYSLYIGQDERNSESNVLHLGQGGIALPDRDYYFNRDSSTTRVRNAYRKHVAAMFVLLGETPARAQRSSAEVFALEKALAERSRTLEQLRDPWANYNPTSGAKLAALTPGIDWPGQYAGMGIVPQDTVIVGQPEFYARVDSLLGATPIAVWQSYLRWNVVDNLASRLARRFDVEHFHFYGTTLNGTKAQRPRWKRVLDAEEGAMGELMGQAWVRKYCSPATKARYEKLTDDIFAAFRERVLALPWMSETTKQHALAKLAKVGRKVAYPDHWRDFSTLALDRGSYAGNQAKLDEWWFAYEAAKLGKPVDRTTWDMSPQTYNAYYDPSKVEIVLPAAEFMLPGLPDSLVDDALLYSYAGGSTIGHELTHGFDDEGRQYDEHGNLNPWWTDQDSVQFTQRAHKLAAQFDEFVVGDKHVRGEATLGENLADLGGINLGYDAFQKTEQAKRGESINGLTPDQRYFLGYALSWLGQTRPEALAMQIMSNVHAPGFLRVNGPLPNIPAFYKAFGIKPGERMYRAENLRADVW